MTAVKGALRSRFRLLRGIWLAWGILLWVSAGRAHELEIDTLSIRYTPGSRAIAGQFMLNPKVTRPNDVATAYAERKAQVLRFVENHVTLWAGESAVPLQLELRELHEKGGAVPGDSIVFSGTLPQESPPLSVAIRPPLERVAVTVSIGTNHDDTVIVIAGAPVIVSAGMPTKATTKEPGATKTVNRRPMPPAPSPSEILNYVWIGILHIIPLGWDHILFVVALTLGALWWDAERRFRRLLLELTLFTFAHTLTLALGALEFVSISAQIVEPFIAFSIFAVALEHLLGGRDLGAEKRTARRRVRRAVLIALFGLVHGLGFAGALRELGLSGSTFLAFLASFNLGVELGQLAVVLLTLALAWLLARLVTKPERVLNAATLAIGLAGLTVGLVRLL